ncbi:MAG: FMN-binding protein [Bacteroidales bacterium]|nr:FMN-binding protein [Bacteroidales bacterium]
MIRIFQLLILLSCTINSCSNIKAFFNPQPDKEIPLEINLKKIPDNVYKGKYCVGPVKVVTKVTVIGHKIKNIEIIKHRTGQGQAAEAIIDKIIEEQSVCIDVISGATISSKCILKSVETALKNN